MKKLENLKNIKVLSKIQQKNINGSGGGQWYRDETTCTICYVDASGFHCQRGFYNEEGECIPTICWNYAYITFIKR